VSDPYFHYKGSVTLENDTRRYVVQGVELWEEREIITIQFDERPWTEYHIPGKSSWHGVAVLAPGRALPGMADLMHGECRVILADGRSGAAVVDSTNEDEDGLTITLTGRGEPPS
jgi:hypothetical protein